MKCLNAVWTVVPAIAVSAVATYGSAAIQDQGTLRARGIIRAGVDAQGRVHGDFAKTTGLKHLTAVAYKILMLDKEGKEVVVDEREHIFKVGDRFRISIEAETDVFVYVFHEGPDKVQNILLPDRFDDGKAPFVRRAERKIVPEDGTYFVFTAPAGTEKIRVYASPERKPELTPKEAFENPTPEQQKMIQSRQEEVFAKATNKAPAKKITDVEPTKLARNNEMLPEFRLRGLDWEPTVGPGESRVVAAGSYDETKRPDVAFDIVLRSVDK